ncbi:MAG: amidohydrolase [Candidatus Wallbacteria bacterium]|nr:amidohydrolase [Candidatus Wallbacteria bacterium]
MSRLFVLFGLLGLASAALGGDLLVTNARVLGHPRASAVLVRGNRIEKVGSALELRRSARPKAQVIDARGGMVVPGFIDPHTHLMDGGLGLKQVQLQQGDTLAAALERVAAYAREHPEKSWVLGSGWGYGMVEAGTFPSRLALDAIVTDRPAVLWSYDGHAAWLNSRALAAAGIVPETADPPDGRIVREPGGRQPEGTLLEGAIGLLDGVLPRPPRAEKLAALEAATAHLSSLGMTSVDDLAESTEELELLDDLRRRGRLPLRVRVCPPLDGDLDAYVRAARRWDGPLVRVGFLKGFVDGVIESRTAYMLSPYAGARTRGRPLLTATRLERLVGRAHGRGFQVALHAIGDAGVRMALDAFERVQRHAPRVGPPHRVEHVEVVSEADVPRFARLGVIASMQPYHAIPSGPEPDSDAWARNLGPRRLRRSFAWRALLDAGATLAFGSDWNVMSADPLHGSAVAATRRNASGEPEDGWNVHQAITAAEALDAYTRSSARAIGRERELGRVEPGFLADLAILSPEARLSDPRSLWRARVCHVILDGTLLP